MATTRYADSDILFEMSDADVERAFKAEQLASKKQNREERKKFADKLYWILMAFLTFVGLIVIACGIEPFPFTLPNSVINTLLATTSANVIGIFIYVVKYLFK
jgi:hypothetical protein